MNHAKFCVKHNFFSQEMKVLSDTWKSSLFQKRIFLIEELCIDFEQVLKANSEGRLVEMFGCGTAVVVCPVGNINYKGVRVSIPVDTSKTAVSKRCFETLQNIQYGNVSHPWAVDISDTNLDILSSSVEKQRLEDYSTAIQKHLYI